MSHTLVLALLVGAFFATGVYLMLRRSTIKLLFGLALIGNGTNLLVFTCAGVVRGHEPLIPAGKERLEAPYADPLSQALILTAIVISFAVLAFAMVLVKRGYDSFGTDDSDMVVETDE